MRTVANSMGSWGARYAQDVERSVNYYNWLNSKQKVRTRQMTEEEIEKIFGDNPNYIQDITIDEVEDEQS